MPFWTLQEAADLCRKIEAIAPTFGCHVALTGSTLYKNGKRKDADIMFYAIRQHRQVIDREALFFALRKIGIEPGPQHGWVWKAHYQNKPIDFMFPEWAADPEGDGYR